MKIIEIPATLRVFVDDSTTAKEALNLAEGLVSDTQGTIAEGELEDLLIDHHEYMNSEAPNILGADLWVYEPTEALKIHEV
jgi:hypothetical protein